MAKRRKQRVGERYTFEELIAFIFLSSMGRNTTYMSMLSRRPVSTIRQKFRELPSGKLVPEEKRVVRRGFSSIQEIYAAFGVPCPETQAELDQDMYERFKKWEEQMLAELIYVPRSRQ